MNKIKITFPDGSNKEFDKGVTPYEVAGSISGRLAKEALVSGMNGSLRDLNIPLNDDTALQIFTFKNKGKAER